MKINPKTFDLFTDSGQFLKTLNCPIRKRWNEMRAMGSDSFLCDSCHREIHDTSHLSDEELRLLLTRDPQACLMVSPAQENCTVLPKGTQDKRTRATEVPSMPPSVQIA